MVAKQEPEYFRYHTGEAGSPHEVTEAELEAGRGQMAQGLRDEWLEELHGDWPPRKEKSDERTNQTEGQG